MELKQFQRKKDQYSKNFCGKKKLKPNKNFFYAIATSFF